MSNLIGYVYLLLAVVRGRTSKGFLTITNGVIKICTTTMCIVSIILWIFLLAKAKMIITVGLTYATYGRLTITAVTIFGVVKYGQMPNAYGLAGIVLIIIGVILVNLLGKTN